VNKPGSMEKANLLYRFYKIRGFSVYFAMAICMGCSKSPVDIPAVVPVPPPLNTLPSGEIQSFVITDSLVAFKTGSTAKWLVVGTNELTVVTFNGVKVPFYGILDTGPLKQTSTFTLAINNGKKASVTLKVVDSVTTLLWNGGSALKQTKAEAYILPAGQTDPIWVDTTNVFVTPRIADQRIYFELNGNSKILQSSGMYVSPGDMGKFVVNSTQTGYTWRGTEFAIVSIDSRNLVVTFDLPQANGSKLPMRFTYMFY
jgi:hypothetical protein